MRIDSFREEYFFLSNFYEAVVEYNGLTFLSSEAAFQAQKEPSRAAEFCYLTAIKAKRLGRTVNIRPDWDEVKDEIMYAVCLDKFTRHADLRAKLIATGDAELIEGNDWDDEYWGVCRGRGENALGKILMRIRSELK